MAPDIGRGDVATRGQPKSVSRPPLSGRDQRYAYPGLKPWAVLFSRFAANSAPDRMEALMTYVEFAKQAVTNPLNNGCGEFGFDRNSG